MKYLLKPGCFLLGVILITGLHEKKVSAQEAGYESGVDTEKDHAERASQMHFLEAQISQLTAQLQQLEKRRQMGVLKLQMVEQERLARERERDRHIEREIKIFKLKYASPEVIGASIDSIDRGESTRLGVDKRSNSLIAQGRPQDLQIVAAVISDLDQPAMMNDDSIRADVQNRSKASESMSVLITWLIGDSTAPDSAEPRPDDLKQIESELIKLGVSAPRLAARMFVRAQPNGYFDMRSKPNIGTSPEVDYLVNMNVTGSIQPTDDSAAPTVELNIHAKSGTTNAQLASLETRISAPYRHPVVLAVSPIDKMTSVFVIQINEEEKTEAMPNDPPRSSN